MGRPAPRRHQPECTMNGAGEGLLGADLRAKRSRCPVNRSTGRLTAPGCALRVGDASPHRPALSHTLTLANSARRFVAGGACAAMLRSATYAAHWPARVVASRGDAIVEHASG